MKSPFVAGTGAMVSMDYFVNQSTDDSPLALSLGYRSQRGTGELRRSGLSPMYSFFQLPPFRSEKISLMISSTSPRTRMSQCGRTVVRHDA
jgi:hypothetical protein